jgi:hypothetical protein
VVAVYCLSVSERFLFMIRTYAVTGGFGLLPLQLNQSQGGMYI